MQEKLTKGIFFGIIGNALFVAFGLICLIFYHTYSAGSFFSRLLEVIAYCTEFMGFGLLVYSDYLLSVSLRLRRLLKISFSAYIILEAIIMVLELNSYRISFYEPYSMSLAIVHAIVSGAACFAFLQLDPENTKYEIAVVVCIALIFCGMLGAIMGIRVYFSVIVNALGFTLLFGSIMYLRSREDIEIDCYGDRARVAVYSSTMFSDEVKEKKKTEEKEEASDKEEE